LGPVAAEYTQSPLPAAAHYNHDKLVPSYTLVVQSTNLFGLGLHDSGVPI